MFSFSHIKAPKNGHHIIPNNQNGQIDIDNIGKTNIQTISPIVAHLVHRLVHHIFFVQIIGMT